MCVMQVSHAVAQHYVLLGQFQQHWVIKELVNTHILAQTLHRTQTALASK